MRNIALQSDRLVTGTRRQAGDRARGSSALAPEPCGRREVSALLLGLLVTSREPAQDPTPQPPSWMLSSRSGSRGHWGNKARGAEGSSGAGQGRAGRGPLAAAAARHTRARSRPHKPRFQLPRRHRPEPAGPARFGPGFV